MNQHVRLLNRKLGDALGYRGDRPRFAWCWAPDQDWFVYDSDDRTLLKRSWANAPAPGGGELGAVWVLGEWRECTTFDHFGFGNGQRIPFVRQFDYAPYFESALVRGFEPTASLTQNYIQVLDHQMQTSFDDYMAEEKFTGDRNREQDTANWNETVAAGYDEHTGAFGNCVPGTAGGFLSFGGI